MSSCSSPIAKAIVSIKAYPVGFLGQIVRENGLKLLKNEEIINFDKY